MTDPAKDAERLAEARWLSEGRKRVQAAASARPGIRTGSDIHLLEMAIAAYDKLTQERDEARATGVRDERERAALIIERGQESQRSNIPGHEDGYYLSPRRHGNLAGLAYAVAIRSGEPPHD